VGVVDVRGRPPTLTENAFALGVAGRTHGETTNRVEDVDVNQEEVVDDPP
jgi:hypothetical protein